MKEYIDAVLEWPLIVQGALGSGLFWLILIIGQYFTGRLSQLLSTYSKEYRLRLLRSQWAKYYGYKALQDGDRALSSSMQVSLLYIAFRDFIRGMIWVVLGMLFSSVFPILGVVGFIGGLYYLFKTLSHVRRIDTTVDVAGKLKELECEISAIVPSNKIQPTANASAD